MGKPKQQHKIVRVRVTAADRAALLREARAAGVPLDAHLQGVIARRNAWWERLDPRHRAVLAQFAARQGVDLEQYLLEMAANTAHFLGGPAWRISDAAA